MKLFYYQDPEGNFGDDLNPWLWDQLLPDFFDEVDGELLVGIGTLLNHKLPPDSIKHIFGAGFGYGAPPKIDDKFRFLCVRGPKTAEALGIDSAFAVTDPAILTRVVYARPGNIEKTRFGFVPHCDSLKRFSWENVCDTLGFKFLNVQWTVDRFLSAMSECDIIICEAMHGAIVADALRIPWIPVKCYGYIDSFKWEDWLATVQLPYTPIKIHSLYDNEIRLQLSGKVKNRIKLAIKYTGLWNNKWSQPVPTPSSTMEIETATNELMKASQSRVYLSDDRVCENLTDRYLELLEKLKQLKQ